MQNFKNTSRNVPYSMKNKSALGIDPNILRKRKILIPPFQKRFCKNCTGNLVTCAPELTRNCHILKCIKRFDHKKNIYILYPQQNIFGCNVHFSFMPRICVSNTVFRIYTEKQNRNEKLRITKTFFHLK